MDLLETNCEKWKPMPLKWNDHFLLSILVIFKCRIVLWLPWIRLSFRLRIPPPERSVTLAIQNEEKKPRSGICSECWFVRTKMQWSQCRNMRCIPLQPLLSFSGNISDINQNRLDGMDIIKPKRFWNKISDWKKRTKRKTIWIRLEKQNAHSNWEQRIKQTYTVTSHISRE